MALPVSDPPSCIYSDKKELFAGKHPKFDLSLTIWKDCQASLYNPQFLKLLSSSGMETRLGVVGVYALLSARNLFVEAASLPKNVS